jgi:hypothetical protein
VGDEHDRPVDGADDLADRLGVGGEAAWRIGGRDDAVAFRHQRIDDAVSTRRLGEGAVDDNDHAGGRTDQLAEPREIGSVATTVVPTPGGLSSSSRPRSAATRSLIPTSP